MSHTHDHTLITWPILGSLTLSRVCVCVCVRERERERERKRIHVSDHTLLKIAMDGRSSAMGWLRLVGSLKL